MVAEHKFNIGELEVHSIFSPFYQGMENYYEYSVDHGGKDVTVSISSNDRNQIENEIERLNNVSHGR